MQQQHDGDQQGRFQEEKYEDNPSKPYLHLKLQDAVSAVCPTYLYTSFQDR